MILKENHKKHGDLTKVNSGNFGSSECAVYGTTCDAVAEFVSRLRSLFPHADIAFVDADHKPDAKAFGGTHFQHKQDSVQLMLPLPVNDFQRRFALNHAHFIVANGNHFQAKKQVVICNSEKENSLRKRIGELTDVVAIISTVSDGKIPAYIHEIIPGAEKIPSLNISDTNALKHFFESQFLQPAPLKALIMAGGRSIRMGKDKTRLTYHREEQFLHLKHVLDGLGIPAIHSCRQDQVEYFTSQGCEVIVDRVSDLGPLGGIVSAFMREPETAWLVLACDLPLLDAEVINELIQNRDHFSVATAFVSPHDRFPEPLIAIWEPKSYPIAMKFISEGYSCPRKVLINSASTLIVSKSPEKLANVNTVDDIDEVMGQIK